MGEKRPQPTAVLLKRLQRLARVLDAEEKCFHTPESKARFRAWANTCWQAAARLEELSDPLAVALATYDEVDPT